MGTLHFDTSPLHLPFPDTAFFFPVESSELSKATSTPKNSAPLTVKSLLQSISLLM